MAVVAAERPEGILIAGVVVALVLFLTLIGIPLAWLLAVLIGLWVLYRLIRGWMTLADGKAIVLDR